VEELTEEEEADPPTGTLVSPSDGSDRAHRGTAAESRERTPVHSNPAVPMDRQREIHNSSALV
jgi:hypothetical protein